MKLCEFSFSIQLYNKGYSFDITYAIKDRTCINDYASLSICEFGVSMRYSFIARNLVNDHFPHFYFLICDLIHVIIHQGRWIA